MPQFPRMQPTMPLQQAPQLANARMQGTINSAYGKGLITPYSSRVTPVQPLSFPKPQPEGIFGNNRVNLVNQQGQRQKNYFAPDLRNQSVAWAQKPIAGFKKGGNVKKTGVYKLHKGEKVIPADKVDTKKEALEAKCK